VRTELLAGLTAFLTMAYIIFVNPSILGDAGMPKDAVFVATCVAAAIDPLQRLFEAAMQKTARTNRFMQSMFSQVTKVKHY
jgi:xanthine/uracil/vitamin C permease (AzgA family)